MLKKTFIFTFVLLPVCFVFTIYGQPGQTIRGVWEVIGITTETQQQSFENLQPLPGLMIFTSDFYSMVWMPGRERVPDNAKIWQPSDQEKVAQFNAIIVNSGKYYLRDSLLITEPVVAKTPEFIGGEATYYWITIGDTLKLQIAEILSHSGVLDEGPQRYRTTIFLKRQEEGN
jgi:hypothetical protein